MTIFNLPDLGEGLPDAEIHEWFVKEGDEIALDQPLVAMETAKAVVEVPSPQQGIVIKLFGARGDVIKTGMPLIEFETTNTFSHDKGTVVGHLEESQDMSEDNFTIGLKTKRAPATPMVRMLARKHQIDLTTLKGSGAQGVITKADVEAAVALKNTPPQGFEPLKGTRRAMLQRMVHSHQEVVPVSIFDEVDVSSWVTEGDITVRLIHAIIKACQQEPALNAWFNKEHSARKCFDTVHLGLAMDTDDGLFVPVIHNAQTYDHQALRNLINDFKKTVHNRTICADKLKDATITLSNFGKFAGRFASPIIVPPTVAILAVGRLYRTFQLKNNQMVECLYLPLSLSFDHRAVTGGEATRFLGAVMAELF
ncbi:MAG TPA: 2-oxo acid dehydrogenase subunit E2 [Legionellales bacterium]|nr:2-oxo acid dehydrogenase subunit E2 [Legionellales bacterium]|tara:strand:- start:4463 stop:5560 length:1098 start_codon:yes stop_codon:yes gene_type:complete